MPSQGKHTIINAATVQTEQGFFISLTDVTLHCHCWSSDSVPKLFWRAEETEISTTT